MFRILCMAATVLLVVNIAAFLSSFFTDAMDGHSGVMLIANVASVLLLFVSSRYEIHAIRAAKGSPASSNRRALGWLWGLAAGLVVIVFLRARVLLPNPRRRPEKRGGQTS